MEAVTRRGFIAVAGTGAVFGAALKEGADDKLTDGGIADVTPPGAVARETRIVPPGAGGHRNFSTRCVGCQLCVDVCPNNVLRPSKGLRRAFQPEMGFEHGYCRPECVKCGAVCPAGAIRRITPAEKRTIHVGQAVYHPERCIAAQEGVNCSACEAHCPVRAIVRVPMEEGNPSSPKIPVVDKTLCIGCGACEHLCPARPAPAMTVEGLERHREVRPMSEADVLAEAARLIREGRAGAVLVKDGVIVAVEPNGPGVKPLLRLHDLRADVMKGAWVVDKVVGRAAAAIAIDGGATRVHGLVMSETAKTLLGAHGVPASADETIPQVLNRTRDGLCPLEDAVKGLDVPAKMIPEIRKRIKKLMTK